jgi:hypothetical protein
MARLRSPNFPGLSLEDAIESAREIFDKSRHAEIPRDAVAKDLGYSGLTGRSVVILGALNQYGLVENTTKGQMKVSQIAADILHGYPESVRLEALYKAGRTPSLFKAIFDKFDNHVPSDNAVRSFLIQSGFTNDGAEKALKTFSDTNRFLEVKGACESYSEQPQIAPESAPDTTTQEQKPVQQEANESNPKSPGGVVFWNKGSLDFNLSSAGLVVAGMTNSASDLKAYIAKLQALVTLLPEGDTEH